MNCSLLGDGVRAVCPCRNGKCKDFAATPVVACVQMGEASKSRNATTKARRSTIITVTITVTITITISLVPTRHRRRGGNRLFVLSFSAAKNSKKTIPARNWRDPDARAAIMIMTHNNTVANTVITIAVTITPPPTHHRRRGGNRVFEVFGS